MPGVVAISVNELAGMKAVFGAVAPSPLENAYKRALDLADAKAVGRMIGDEPILYRTRNLAELEEAIN